MAAGVRLSRGNIDAFRDAFVEAVDDLWPAERRTHEVDLDAECELEAIGPDFGEQLRRLEPFGRENPAPRLCVRNAVVDQAPRRVGQGGAHLSLMLRQQRRVARAIGFHFGELAELLPAGTAVDVAFEPRSSVWQGRLRTELHLHDIRQPGLPIE
jgi:single-stranded-DNA-specific exonuclease